MKDNIDYGVTQEDITPYVSMEFDREEHAYKFYNMYVGFIVFSIRKDWVNKSWIKMLWCLKNLIALKKASRGSKIAKKGELPKISGLDV